MIHEPELETFETIPTTANEPNIIEPSGIRDRRISGISKAMGALKQLQSETRAIEVEFFEHVYQLEVDFQLKHDSVYQKRCEIINGSCAPTEIADFQPTDDEKSETSSPEDGAEKKQSGVPQFWLTVLRSSLPDIHENDKPILQHLTDVRAKNKPLNDLGFILEFHFAPNEFFQNAVLRKEYHYSSSENKMIHEIPLIRKSVGCAIEWKQGKKPVHCSWFDFLSSSKIISDSDADFMAYISGIQKDFEMGYFIKEHVIPKAVLYFTGEEKNCFSICNYNAGYWTPVSSSSSSSTSESSSEDDSASVLEAVHDQGEIPAEDVAT